MHAHAKHEKQDGDADIQSLYGSGSQSHATAQGCGVEDVLCISAPVEVELGGYRGLVIGQATKPIAPGQAVAFSLPAALALPKITNEEVNVLQLLPVVHQAGELVEDGRKQLWLRDGHHTSVGTISVNGSLVSTVSTILMPSAVGLPALAPPVTYQH
jgi:hypothetical protein